ncbi:TPA: hypothetical protein DIV49_01845 [Candidatus Saccharibacteria bacterium]|nr:hypothetical protein [Candidatus Saccharibacteria bacterium]HRJ90683.1 hypothetical protein [Candidatus Saccharibacteria bacterium]
MNVALVFLIVTALLFGLAYLTKRRFGVLGLALAAGAMLSDLWAQALTPVIEQTGVMVERPPLATLVAIALVLLPAVILLSSGPSYRDMTMRIAGAACFAALAIALLVEPLGSALVLTGESKVVYDFFVQNRVYIVTAGLVIALVDVLATHTGHRIGRGKH